MDLYISTHIVSVSVILWIPSKKIMKFVLSDRVK